MYNVLIIYECVPDYLEIYFEEVTEEELQKLLKCHNKYANSDEWEEEQWISNWIMDKRAVYDNTADNKDAVELKLNMGGTIIVTGFVL